MFISKSTVNVFLFYSLVNLFSITDQFIMFSKAQFLLIALVLPAICTCASLGEKFENNEDKTSQGAKRDSGNPFERGGQVGDKFQPWEDWMNKRGFGLVGADDRFGTVDRNVLQGWNDWMSKRTGDDQWNSWDSSRYPPGFGAGSQYQRWDDFVKRQYPFMPTGLNGLSRSNYQSWQDWMKRGGVGDLGAFGYGGYGNNDLLMSWEDLSKLNKRYQWFGVQPFNSFRRPYSNGLQDWRATTYGVKRSTEENEKTEN